jgi:hypothetical protein
MASEKQTEANRANARRSTGPRTAAGKARTSRNAIKHGLLGRHLLLERESAEDYDALLNGLIDSHQPVDTAEALLVEKMAIALWKMRRLHAVETAAIHYSQATSPSFNRTKNPEVNAYLDALQTQTEALPANDQRLIRYQGQLEGQFYRALAALQMLQTRRANAIAGEARLVEDTGEEDAKN